MYGNAGAGAFGADPHRQSQYGAGGRAAWEADHDNGAKYQQGRGGHGGLYGNSGPYGRPGSSVSTMARPDPAHDLQQHQQQWAHGMVQQQQPPLSYTQQPRNSQQYAPCSAGPRHPSTAPSSSQLYSQQQGLATHNNWPSQSQHLGGTQPAYHTNGNVNYQRGGNYHSADAEEYDAAAGLDDIMEEEEEEEQGRGGYHLGQQRDPLRPLTQMNGGLGGRMGAAGSSLGREEGHGGGGGGSGGGSGATAAHAYEGGPGSDRLVAVRELPEVFQALFPHYRWVQPGATVWTGLGCGLRKGPDLKGHAA